MSEASTTVLEAAALNGVRRADLVRLGIFARPIARMRETAVVVSYKVFEAMQRRCLSRRKYEKVVRRE